VIKKFLEFYFVVDFLMRLNLLMDIYEFQIKGHLDDRWSDWLGGLAIERHEDGTTVLVGPLVDQAALYGVIIRLRDLGLPLLSVSRVAEAHGT
jgi:hypothetical protein